MTADERCIADGCGKKCEPGRKYCPGHRKRERQGKAIESGPLREYGQAPDAYLKAKAEEWANAKDNDEAESARAWKRLRYAAVAFVKKTTRQKVPKAPDTTTRG